jgi:formate transporter
MEEDLSDVGPANQFLAPEGVISEMAHVDAQRAAERSGPEVLLLSTMAGGLVGMAAFLAVMGRTIIGKYIPVLLLVCVFVASGFLHSPANMAYFALTNPDGIGPGWGAALQWGVLPAALGNVLGAFFLVALPFWYLDGRSAAPTSQPIVGRSPDAARAGFRSVHSGGAGRRTTGGGRRARSAPR